MINSVIRGAALGLLLLLGACSRGANGVGSGPPGIDVADAAMKGGSPEIALQISTNILAQYPGNMDALLTKGEALSALGRNDEAMATFSAVLAIDHSSVGANIGLGRLRLGTDPVAAEQLFLQAISREPRNDVALNDLGIARDLQGRHTDAQTAYREALGINPEMAAAEVNLALSLAMSGHSRDAVQLLQPLANRPNATEQMRHDFAAVLTMSGDRPGAETILSKDLPPDQVQQALAAFASAPPNVAATMLNPAQAPPPSPPTAVSAAPATSAAPAPAPAPSNPAPPLPETAAVTPPPPPPSPSPPPAVSAAPATSASPVPAQTPAVATPPAPPPTDTSEASNSGPVQVQLAGPVASKGAAETKWERLAKEMPNQLSGRQPIMAEEQEHGHTVWRVRTGGFSDSSEANALCEQVRSTGTSCKLIQ